MRHESHKVFKGCLAEFDLHRNFAVVAVSRLNDVQFGPFQHALETLPHGEVLVAVGRDVSGKVRAKSVELNVEGISEDDEDLHCKTSEVHLHIILFLLCIEAIIIFSLFFCLTLVVYNFILFNCNPCCM